MEQEAITELKPSDMALAIEDAIRSNRTPIVLSSPGMGKSDIIRQVARSKSVGDWAAKMFAPWYRKAKRNATGMRLVDERTSTMDITDWRGVPDIDRERKRTVWFPPDFLPSEEDGPTIVFLDEITQARADTQPPLYQLLLDRKLGTVYRAPEHTRFIAAGNKLDDGTYANKLGSALRDRIVFLFLKPDVEDWCKWAYTADIAPAVIAFIRFRSELLYKFDKNRLVSPTARGWEFVSDMVKNAKSKGIVRDALIEGKVGHGAMIEYTGFERMFDKLPNVDALLLNPDTAVVPEAAQPELAYALANALSLKATVVNIDRVLRYLQRLPSEYATFSVKMATRRDPKLQATPAFTRWAVDHAAELN